MESLLKHLVLLGLIGGIVYLASNNLNGWGWLVFLFILTLFAMEDSTPDKKVKDE
jgi:hypothetical protein